MCCHFVSLLSKRCISLWVILAVVCDAGIHVKTSQLFYNNKYDVISKATRFKCLIVRVWEIKTCTVFQLMILRFCSCFCWSLELFIQHVCSLVVDVFWFFCFCSLLVLESTVRCSLAPTRCEYARNGHDFSLEWARLAHCNKYDTNLCKSTCMINVMRGGLGIPVAGRMWCHILETS